MVGGCLCRSDVVSLGIKQWAMVDQSGMQFSHKILGICLCSRESVLVPENLSLFFQVVLLYQFLHPVPVTLLGYGGLSIHLSFMVSALLPFSCVVGKPISLTHCVVF